MSAPDAPLPLTPLVYRALHFAQSHHHLLNLSRAVMPSVARALSTDLHPTWSHREADMVDRYDIMGLFLYVRPDTVVLVAGERVLCASACQHRIYIRHVSPTDPTPHSDDILMQEPL